MTGGGESILEDQGLLPEQPAHSQSQALPHDDNKLISRESKEERVGTPYYLAPELWKGHKCTKKSDIWALGVILYELCCLGYPYPATNEEELKQKVLNDKPEKFPNHVSKEFQELINKMLRKDASKRPCIEEIIYSDLFQQKAQQNLITLPLILNKTKLNHMYNIGKIDKMEVKLSNHQKKLLGFEIISEQDRLKFDSSRPTSRSSVLSKNKGLGEERKEKSPLQSNRSIPKPTSK